MLIYGVSVPKKNFKKAVDRNKIKRQLRQGLKAIYYGKEIIDNLIDDCF